MGCVTKHRQEGVAENPRRCCITDQSVARREGAGTPLRCATSVSKTATSSAGRPDSKRRKALLRRRCIDRVLTPEVSLTVQIHVPAVAAFPYHGRAFFAIAGSPERSRMRAR